MNFQQLDLNLLRVFDVVMTERNLTRAAGQLALSQSAVSHALRRLRDALDDELLTRTASGVAPTPRAQSLWPAVRDALSRLEQAIAPTEFDPCGDEPHNFLLSMADSSAALLMPPLVAAIERLRANINLQVLPLLTRDPRKLLEADETDVAIGYFPTAVTAILREGLQSSLRRAPLFDSDYFGVMRAGHPLADAAAPLDLQRFCATPQLAVSLSGRADGPLDAALAALGRHRRVLLVVNQFSVAVRLLLGSDLIAVLPQVVLGASGVALDRLALRAVPLEVGWMQVEMLWHARYDAAPAQRWLRQQLTAAVIEAGLLQQPARSLPVVPQ